MERHLPKIDGADKYKVNEGESFIDHYTKAKEFTKTFYADVYNKYLSLSFQDTTPQSFFEELIWVIHASGFSAKAVGTFIPKILPAYGDLRACDESDVSEVYARVLPICNNPAKVKSVWECSHILMNQVKANTWGTWIRDTFKSPSDFTMFPYVGNVTCFHIARNLGFLDSVKPDLHLNRLADFYGFESAEAMCKAAEDEVPLGLVDLALWYHCSTFGTQQFKTAK